MQIINGLKRLIYGATTHFIIKQGSVALRGASFVELYKERLKYPLEIVGIEIKAESKNKAEFRVLCNGEKVFPFGKINDIPNGAVNVIPIRFAADSLMCIEVKGMSPKDGFVIILSELNCIEYR